MKVRKNEIHIKNDEEFNWDTLKETIMNECTELIKEDSFEGASDEDLQILISRKRLILKSLKDCVYCIDSAKEVVIQLIYDIIAKYCRSEKEICTVLNFNNENLDAHIEFEILMYLYKKKYKKDALAEMIKEYNLDRIRYTLEDGKPSYMITEDDIHTIYKDKNIILSYTDMVAVLAVLMYQEYKGLGCIDTVREMNINGINIGTSGQVLSYLSEGPFMLTRSVWLYFAGKQIHLRFLKFESEGEMMRLVQLASRYNNPGALTEKKGFQVNTMYDKSRILAVRPSMAETWAFFIRKFSLGKITAAQIVKKDYVHNGDFILEFLKYLMICKQTTAFTGKQGSGKTTLMSAVVEFIDPRKTIRVIELAPELYLRELYPERNILSLQETEFVTSAMAQDALKKSDGAVSMVGEVASDVVALRMIQLAQVASEFTIFSHHANTGSDLIYAIRNSVVQAGGFSNTQIAEQQVVDVIKWNVHLDMTAEGKRYIKRITEIVPVEQSQEYPKIDETNLALTNTRLNREFYYRMTDRKTFKTQDIIVYDLDTDTYIPKSPPSASMLERMCSNLTSTEKIKFLQYIASNWNLKKGA